MPRAIASARVIGRRRRADATAGDPQPYRVPEALEAIRHANAARRTKLVVLDDDPTGTQTVGEVPVITSWREADLNWAFDQPASMFTVLTNSRSLPEREAVELNAYLGRRLASLAGERGVDLRCISRGDSTLRGHFPAETSALAAGLRKGGQPTSGVLLCPCFLEAGRITAHDVHWVCRGEWLVPVGETEFARDPAFGYRESDLRRWVAERGGASIERTRSVSLEDVREGGPGRVAARLAAMSASDVAIANATDPADLEVLVLGLLEAEEQGARLLYRSGPSFLGARAGQEPRAPLSGPALETPSGSGLLVVGSYTELTTRQLRVLHSRHDLTCVELHVPELASDDGWHQQVDAASAKLNQALASGDAVLATTRTPAARVGHEDSLNFGRRITDALVEVVRRIDPTFALSWIIAKGGITSSEIASRALEARRAIVRGQLFPGLVSVWTLDDQSRRPGLSYVVFAGNVGDETTLADAVDQLKVR
jgi:uncharacterized protein YgbK (DUF1537 family)